MNFQSLDYVLFLPIALAGYWLLRSHDVERLGWLFGVSCLFYMAWNAAYIALMLGTISLDFVLGRLLATTEEPRRRRLLLWCSVVTNLGALGVFKYFDFFAGAIADGLAQVGLAVAPATLGFALPVGISFYTFQSLAYAIDVYRRRMPAEPNWLRYVAFVTFFPQLVAGPIVRASELLPQLMRRPTVTRTLVARGLFVIATGMVKKIGVADYLAVNFVDRVFDDPSAYTSTEVMLALYGYTLQIYCDFSGYTDVARGSGMLFGLTLPENFDRPYQATNPAEFWRRWHMTLSSWLRDYLYFPLGGSKVSPARAYFNLWITLFLIGLWHGAAWTFVIYGMLHATVMIGHRFVSRNTPRKPDGDTLRSRVIKVVATLHFVVLSRVFFRATDLGNARDVLERLAAGDVGYGHMVTSVWCLLVIGYVAHYLPRDWYSRAQETFVKLPAPAQGLALAGVGGALLQVVSADVVPYIYLQF